MKMGKRARRIERINFVEYNAKINTMGSYNAVFPKHGTITLAALLRDLGYEVKVFLEGVSDVDFHKIADCDLVCFPVYAPALTKVKACAERMIEEEPATPIIMGGPHVCFFPETVVPFCDYAVRCEGDEVLPRLIDCLNGEGEAHKVQGISFLRDGRIVHNPDPPPPEIPDTIPDPELIEGFERVARPFLGRSRVINTIQTSRGCKFRCKFCPTLKLFQGVYRNRDIDSVVKDFKHRKKYNDSFLVVDNDFCSDRERAKDLLNRLIDEDLGLMLSVFERHEIGRDAEMLELLRKAGVEVIVVGVESLLDENLEAYNKRQKRDDVLKSIQRIQDHGMHVLATFVLGSDTDTPAVADQIASFIKETQLSLSLFILHDLEEDERKGLMIPLNRRFKTHWYRTDPEAFFAWDYATGGFASYFPKRMKPSTLQRAILDVNREVYSHRNILRHAFEKNVAQSLYKLYHGYAMKRMNDTARQVVDTSYLEYLMHIEEGLYDGNEVLREEKLDSLQGLPLPPPVAEDVDTKSYETAYLLAAIPGMVRLGVERLIGKTE
jgi:radical SAM superfamily enzyme YgiQ (UPF0313 family)